MIESCRDWGATVGGRVTNTSPRALKPVYSLKSMACLLHACWLLERSGRFYLHMFCSASKSLTLPKQTHTFAPVQNSNHTSSTHLLAQWSGQNKTFNLDLIWQIEIFFLLWIENKVVSLSRLCCDVVLPEKGKMLTGEGYKVVTSLNMVTLGSSLRPQAVVASNS